MKIRCTFASIAVAAACISVSNLNAALAPASEPLPNFDKRKESGPKVALQAHQVASPQNFQGAKKQAAAARLRTLLPGIKIVPDPIVGTPRNIQAARGFLTGPTGKGITVPPEAIEALPQNDPHRPIKAFFDAHPDLFGYDSQALSAARVKRDDVTARTGLRTVIWEQVVNGVPVFEGLVSGNMTKNGELVRISSRFVPSLAEPGAQWTADAPAISAAKAVSLAAANLGTDVDETAIRSANPPEGAEQVESFTADPLRGFAKARLVWLPLNADSLRLCWKVELTTRARPELYSAVVDATTGEVLVRRCLTNYAAVEYTYNVFDQGSPSPFVPGWPSPNRGQPPTVQRKLVKVAALSTNASPNGWVTANETKGNNVDAHTDLDDDDIPDLPRPTATNRVFNFPLDLGVAPSNYTNAAVVNLFYWCNLWHDRIYDVGFTESAGNFQDVNFGRGGVEGDAVQADAQDGNGFNNANFSTPQDGEPGRMQMFVWNDADPNRDGDLDSDVILHEHTHGLSNRLVGGGVGISSLQAASMGEGWSDFYAIALASPTNASVHANYAFGGYVTYKLGGLQENYYYGIRRYPYSTDLTKNPLTLKDIDPTQASAHSGIPISPINVGVPADEVHAAGEVWCAVLWEARANILDKLGYAEGTQTILQIVTDAMKLDPENPTFLEARDSIILADEIASGGDNRSELWQAFAKRGMGASASVPDTDTTIGIVEAFDLPDDVALTPPDGILEISISPPDRSVLFASTTEPIFVRVSDGTGVTNATITATVTGVGPLQFSNNGVDPDKTADNAVYSAALTVPTNLTSITLTVIVAAPGKETATNVLTYTIIPVPPNDNFTNALKVAQSGGVFISNNKLATVEPGEPRHAGVTNSGASLWWSYSTSVSADILIDTAGSDFDTIIAVYTGTALADLKPVVAANDIGKRKQAFVTLHAEAAVPYYIAIASANTNSTGSLRLQITPGGIPDTTAPVVVVTSPGSGLSVSTNRVTLTGTAVDPQPSPSGIKQLLVRVNPGLGASNDLSPGAGGNSSQQGPTSTNWTRVIALRAGLNIVQVSAIDFAGNTSESVTLQISYRPIDPVNDQFVNAILLTGSAGTNSVSNANATKEQGEPAHAGNNGGKSVWWAYVPNSDGVLLLSTTNSTFDTLLGVYHGDQVAALTQVISNDDAFENSKFSKVQFGVTANQVYRIAVDGFGGASGVVALTYAFTPTNLVTLTVSNTVGGLVSPGSGRMQANTTVSLTAFPETGYNFVDWEGDVSSTSNPLSLVLASNTVVLARFAPREVSDDFSSGDLSGLNWQTSTNGGWFVDTVSSQVVTAGATGAVSTAVSILPSSYQANQRFTVTINATPAPAVSSWFVQDTLPLGWVASSVNLQGTHTATTVRWGPFFDHDARTLTYQVTPLPNAAGPATFSGTATFNGTSVPISGARQIGLSAARSGHIKGGQTSILTLVTNSPAGSGSFDYRVSSEPNWDFLEFWVNGVPVQRWSGEVGWATYPFVTTAGTNVLEWRYVKDAINDVGLDAAFIDNVILPVQAPLGPPTPASLSISVVGTGTIQLQLTGQANQNYITEASRDFNQWQPISTNTAVNGTVIFVDPEAITQPIRFYRSFSQ